MFAPRRATAGESVKTIKAKISRDIEVAFQDFAATSNDKVYEAKGLLREAQRKIDILERVIDGSGGPKAAGAPEEAGEGGGGPPPSQSSRYFLGTGAESVAAAVGRGELVRVKAGGQGGPELIALSPSTLKAHLKLVLAAASQDQAAAAVSAMKQEVVDAGLKGGMGMDDYVTEDTALATRVRSDDQRQVSGDSSLAKFPPTPNAEVAATSAPPPSTAAASSAEITSAAAAAAAAAAARAPSFSLGTVGVDDGTGAGSARSPVHPAAAAAATAGSADTTSAAAAATAGSADTVSSAAATAAPAPAPVPAPSFSFGAVSNPGGGRSPAHAVVAAAAAAAASTANGSADTISSTAATTAPAPAPAPSFSFGAVSGPGGGRSPAHAVVAAAAAAAASTAAAPAPFFSLGVGDGVGAGNSRGPARPAGRSLGKPSGGYSGRGVGGGDGGRRGWGASAVSGKVPQPSSVRPGEDTRVMQVRICALSMSASGACNMHFPPYNTIAGTRANTVPGDWL